MNVEVEDFKTGWFKVSLGLKAGEIDVLIERLKSLKADGDQHFHIASNFEGDTGISDIEFYINDEDQDNMFLLSQAIEPNI